MRRQTQSVPSELRTLGCCGCALAYQLTPPSSSLRFSVPSPPVFRFSCFLPLYEVMIILSPLVFEKGEPTLPKV